MRLNAIDHVEWATSDVESLKTYVSSLFGWEFQPFGEGYYFGRPGGEAGASVGLAQNERAQVGGGTPNVYVAVESIDDCLARAQQLGGSVAVPKSPIPGQGSFAFLKAPDGNLIGLFEYSG